MSPVITPNELNGLNERQLCALYRQVQERLAQSAPGSAEAAQHRASLQVVARAIGARRQPQPKPPGF